MKLTAEQRERLTAEEQEKWQGELDKFHTQVRNNNRRHKEKRDRMDTTIADREPEEDERVPKAKMLKLSNDEDWIDIIYGRKPEDLHQLVSDPKISEAIQGLTFKQKQVLSLNVVHQFTTNEIAQMTGTTDRNVRKHRDKALETIRKAIGLLQDNKGEVNMHAALFILLWLTLPTFMVGWEISKRICPKLMRTFTQKAA